MRKIKRKYHKRREEKAKAIREYEYRFAMDIYNGSGVIQFGRIKG